MLPVSPSGLLRVVVDSLLASFTGVLSVLSRLSVLV
jgi:hypothetical protein